MTGNPILIADSLQKQREEILKAFAAKYNLSPEECEQCYQILPDGSVSWFVRKRENLVDVKEPRAFKMTDPLYDMPFEGGTTLMFIVCGIAVLIGIFKIFKGKMKKYLPLSNDQLKFNDAERLNYEFK